MNAPELIFEEPPPLHSGRGNVGKSPLGKFLCDLREHPGQWARFPDPMSATTATIVRQGRAYGIAAGDYEVRTTTLPGTRKVTIFARYIGSEL